MKLILTPQQMKNIDGYAIHTLRISSLQLMEHAGNAVVKEILKWNRLLKHPNKKSGLSGATKIIVFCGKGNNGGDGFVVARILAKHHYDVLVVLIEGDKELRGDALVNYQRLQDDKTAKIEILRYEEFQKQRLKKFDVSVDAMLGTSFQGELKGKYRAAVEWCNKQSAFKIAVDIPTGLNGETGEVLSKAFCANVTVTMSNPKIGFYRERAKEYTGDVVIADIGIPNKAISHIVSMRVPLHSEHRRRKGIDNSCSDIVLVEVGDIRKKLPKRASNSHKHSVGKIFVLAGSKSMMGAAYLCSQSAMRSGAGQVILGIPDSEYPVIAKRTIEVMPLGLPSIREGSIAISGKEEIEKRIDWADIVLLGCGMSRNEETQQLIRDVILSCSKPLVIDADGLNALIDHLTILKNRKTKYVIITPHLGEFSRLVGIPSAKIEENKYSIASDFAKQYNVILVLKGAPTIVADPDGKIFMNSSGNPGMSSAGSGDVLAGIVTSFFGQGNSARDAAINGVYIHGRAGDIAADTIGVHGMIASDMVKYIPTAIQEVVRK